MNIRKKLTIANILMLLIPVIVSLALSLVILFDRGDGIINRLRSMYENDNGLLNVQTILYQYKDQILSYEPLDNGKFLTDLEKEIREDWEEEDWEDEDEDDEEDDEEDDLWERIEEKEEKRIQKAFGGLTKSLKRLGYSYQISWNDRIMISNLPEEASSQIGRLAGNKYEDMNSFSLVDDKISILKRTYQEEGKKIEVLAYCKDYVIGGEDSQVIREIFYIAGIFALILLVSIVICVIVLTRWISSGMKKTLGQLSEGVKQVQEGNLSYRIGSKAKDELGKACREFDEMTVYLEQSVEERERYEAAKKQMLAGISHDLRTPLTSIKAYVEGLKDGIANTEEKKRRYYEALAIRIGDLESLIDNLTLFSRFDRKEYHYTMEKIEIGSFLDNFFSENQIEFQKNEMMVEKKRWPTESLFIKGDKKQLKRVLGNLVENTIKYREKDSTLWTVSLQKKKDYIELSIADDGPGVEEEDRSRIFDTFYRSDKARQNPGNGSGLGLSIVKEILEGHGAQIRAETGEDGKGLNIIMEFPLEEEVTG